MSSADSTELGYVSDVNPETESEKLPESSDDYETETEDEKSEGVQSETSDEYESAVIRYAQLITDVPQEKLSGIVETIEDLLTGKLEFKENNVNNDGMENILFAVFITVLIITAGAILGMEFGSKTNFPVLA